MDVTTALADRTAGLPTPVLVMDLDEVRAAYRRMAACHPGVEVCYAVKANDDPRVVAALRDEGASFDVASVPELDTVLTLGVPTERILCLHPVKSAALLQACEKAGVRGVAFDSTAEIDKIALHAPGSEAVLRVTVPADGSEWPLTGKFGVEPGVAVEHLEYARAHAVAPAGLTFHVGSQCARPGTWETALGLCARIRDDAARRGIALRHLSLGGGHPITYTAPVPPVEDIGLRITAALDRYFGPGLRVTAEPGRALVGRAGVIVTTVIGKAQRGGRQWLYTDVGVFNGLMETIGGIRYEVRTTAAGALRPTTVGGPSCDSVDVPFPEVLLPDVDVRERLYVLGCGAYTGVYASSFNGFAPLDVHVLAGR